MSWGLQAECQNRQRDMIGENLREEDENDERENNNDAPDVTLINKKCLEWKESSVNNLPEIIYCSAGYYNGQWQFLFIIFITQNKEMFHL